MPIYAYDCTTCKQEFDEFFTSFSVAEKHTKEYPCPDCEQMSPRVFSGSPPAVTFKGYFPGERVKEVDARKRRQVHRLDQKVKDGELTKHDVNKMAALRDKFASASPYLTDPTKDGKQDPNPEDPSAGHFHHEQEI